MAFFPSSVPTVLNLLQAKNNKSVTLTAAINDSLTTIPVSDTSELPASGYVTSGDGSKEAIYYASKTASTLETATRGADGTTASSHASGSTLEMWGNAAYHNLLAEEIIAIANNLSSRIGLSATQVIFADGTVGSPSAVFSGSLTTGFYQSGADVIDVSVSGVQKAQFNTTGLTLASTGGSGLRVYGGSGAHQWDIYLSSNNLRFSDNTTGGAAQFDAPIFASSGSSTDPSYTFTSNSTSGFYLSATDEISITLGASRIAILDSAGNRFRVLRSAAGAEVSMQVFNSDNTNTSSNGKFEIFSGGSSGGDAFLVMGVSGVTNWAVGVDNSDGDCINLTEGSTLGGVNTRLRMPSGGQLQMSDGSASAPQYSFISDPNTGFYSGGSDILSVAVGGSQIANFSSNGLTMTSTGGSGLRIYGSNGTNQWDIYLNSTNIRFGDNTSGGSVVFDTPINIGNTVNVVSPTSPNRTITLIVGGTTYYVHAKTTND